MSNVIKSLSLVAMLATSLSLISLPASAQADEEAERRAKALKEEAEQLREKGHVEEAEKLAREAEMALKKGARKAHSEGAEAHHREMRQLKERLHELRSRERKIAESDGPKEELAEIREQAERVQRELEFMARPHHPEVPPQFREQAEKLELAGRRLQHLRVAAENLKAAEMHDMAHAVMEKAGHLEKEIHAQKEELAHAIRDHHKGEPGHPPEHVAHEEMHHLRQEVEALRRELKDAHQALDRLRERAKAEESADPED